RSWFSALFHLGRRRRLRTVADNEQDRLLVLGAVVVNAARVVHHNASCRHRNRAAGVEFRAGADPPRSLQHGDEAVMRMEVRSAEVIARSPLYHDGIESRLGG